MIFHKFSLLFVLLLSSWILRGQTTRDAGLWMSGKMEADIGKKLDFYVAPEVRINENLSQVSGFFSDIGVNRGFSDLLSVRAEIRLGGRREKTWYESRNRFSLGVALKQDLGEFTFGMLARRQFTGVVQNREGDVDLRNTNRLKFSVKYGAIKKTDLSAAFELFSDGLGFGLSDWRFQTALERKIDKRNVVEFGYLIQKEIQKQHMDFVVRIGYTHFVDWDKKKAVEK